MDVKEIEKKVSDMINCQDAEEYSWKYQNIVTPSLCEDYDSTYSYLKHISKEHLLHLTAGMDEIVEYFNEEALVDLIVERYTTLIGIDGDKVDIETIKSLKHFLH